MTDTILSAPCDYCEGMEAKRRADWCNWSSRGLKGAFHHACADRHQKAMEESEVHRRYCHVLWCDQYPLPDPVVSLNEHHGNYVVGVMTTDHTIKVTTDVCYAAWGPGVHGPKGWRIGHYCGKGEGHKGRHVCDVDGCRSWKPAEYPGEVGNE